MSGLLLMAHAPLASALRDVAAHVFPEAAARMATVDVQSTWSDDQVESALREALVLQGAAQTLILTDVFGATPCNVAQRVADGSAVRVVCGLNVPMLWRALCYEAEPLETLVGRAVSGGSQGVMQTGTGRPQAQAPMRNHDSTDAHHQQ